MRRHAKNDDHLQNSTRPVVIFVSEIEPDNSAASSVVIYRHLRSLQREGYQICVIVPDRPGVKTRLPKSWKVIPLPSRRFFYPPYRPYGPLRTTRWLLLDQIVRSQVNNCKIQCVIGLLMGEYLTGYAEWLSRGLSSPLFYFYHDRGEHLHHANNPKNAARLKRQNLRLLNSPMLAKVWTVAPQLTYSEDGLDDKFSVVYPLPERLELEPSPSWSDSWQGAPVLAHIGTIYRETLDSFRSIVEGLHTIGGRLLLYSQFAETAEVLQREYPQVVEFRGFAPNTMEFLVQLKKQATAFVVVYPDDPAAMPWSTDCFPSKFTQIVQTGLPALIFAPSATSIGRWCTEQQWLLYSSTSKQDSVGFLLEQITRKSIWNHAAEQSRKAASGVFNPALIEAIVNKDVKDVSDVFCLEGDRGTPTQ